MVRSLRTTAPGDTQGSKKSCTEAIRVNDEPRLYCDRAEAYLAEDMFEEALGDYRAALEREEGFTRAKEGMAKTQKLQKQVGLRLVCLLLELLATFLFRPGREIITKYWASNAAPLRRIYQR